MSEYRDRAQRVARELIRQGELHGLADPGARDDAQWLLSQAEADTPVIEQDVPGRILIDGRFVGSKHAPLLVRIIMADGEWVPCDFATPGKARNAIQFIGRRYRITDVTSRISIPVDTPVRARFKKNQI